VRIPSKMTRATKKNVTPALAKTVTSETKWISYTLCFVTFQPPVQYYSIYHNFVRPTQPLDLLPNRNHTFLVTVSFPSTRQAVVQHRAAGGRRVCECWRIVGCWRFRVDIPFIMLRAKTHSNFPRSSSLTFHLP
jgi:hypothetical protein